MLNNAAQNSKEEFRDHLATVTQDGKRKWIFPKKPSGRFHNFRVIVSILLLAFLFGVPFIKVNGHPLMLFDLLERKFIIFGVAFSPHDFHLFVIAVIIFVVSVFLFTVVYGRLFCGWTCPQTIFMEMVFRKIEYLIEGDYQKQKALKKAPWSFSKIFKKVLKQSVFFIIAFIIANALLAWIIGIDGLYELASKPISEVPGKFTAMVIFTFITYSFGAYFREQVCTIICPYGRLQGVMLDQNSIVIAYDYKRGELRGKIKKGEENKYGDCIDCKQCVYVCPTGIDIRNGTQLECVNCTACIDACDAIMDKVDRPRGLVRYASKEEIESGKRKIFTPKAIGYTIVLFILFGLLTFLLATRSDFELSILRTAGLMAQEQPDGRISNLYDMKIINKTFDEMPAELELIDPKGEIKLLSGELNVEPHGYSEAKFFVIFDISQIKNITMPIKIAVKSNNEIIDVISTTFLGKVKGKKE